MELLCKKVLVLVDTELLDPDVIVPFPMTVSEAVAHCLTGAGLVMLSEAAILGQTVIE